MIKPYGKNVLVKPVEKKQILVSEQGNLCEYGEVVAIGDEVTTLKVGEVIGYTIWGVNRLTIHDVNYYFIPESDEFILGTIYEKEI